MNMEQKAFFASLLANGMQELNVYSVVIRILLSLVFSSVIGCERSSKRHSAGLRTFILVSLTATTAMLSDQFLFMNKMESFPIISASAIIASAMISSNSILFSSRNQIKGLTTSAGLWACCLVGVALGAGLYQVAFWSFVTLFASLSLLPVLEKYLKDRSNHFDVHLELKNRGDLQAFVATVRKLGIRIDDIESNPAYLNSGLSVYSVSLSISSKELKKYKKHSEIIEALRSLDYIFDIEEMV